MLAFFVVIAYADMGLPSAFSLVIRQAALVPTMIGLAAVPSVGTVLAVMITLHSDTPGR
ncbi:hypothetical protein [Streptomyces sp. GESEQ-4]|uniref:hypothetical protein n=1 Tax=Streptomyces sp. GESEQ-4 TaxID=2812655 RepID=UPI001B33A4FF|nr:hypothetical protein [Streptomyces sp. GESEQ-4]